MREYFPVLSENSRRWARFLALIVGVVLFVWLCRLLYGVLTLLAVSFALAYIFNPLITALEKRGARRLSAIIGLYLISFVIIVFGTLILGAIAQSQVQTLIESLPEYIANAQVWGQNMFASLTGQSATTTQPGDDNMMRDTIRDWVSSNVPTTWSHVSLLGQVFSGVSALLTALVLIPMFTFFFLWQYEDMLKMVRDHLPAAYRDTVVHIAKLIDEKNAEFFRGRVVVSAIVGLLTGIGWSIVQVPYSLPFGAAVAVLNIVPFLSLAVLPPVLLATFVHNSGDWATPVLMAMVIYTAVQGLESFVLYPYFSAKTSGLHPVTTMVVLLIGAELAGLLGMLLSIPITSTLKSLGTEYVLPELRRLAQESDGDAGDDPPPNKERQPNGVESYEQNK
ncbi:MAG: AI-2E family transporter [Phycisphaerae bacterium]|nr:AI-2E family transporter [Phycisphaerae bacterium]